MTAGRNAPVWSAVLAVLLALICLVPAGKAGASPNAASLVIDAASGRILHAENADARRHPASLTKMMTLYMVFEALDAGRWTLNQRLPVSATAAAQAPSKLGLKRGSSIAVKDAILALVTKSANDVAAVVAEAIAGSESAFARRMTERAQQLGMTRTTFRNASGLPDPTQVTTARDMAILALALLRHYPRYYDFFSTRHFAFGGKVFENHNKLLGRYGGVDGIKTGYIRASGFNLVASAQRGDIRLIGVVFGGTTPASRNQDMTALLDAGFAAARHAAPVRVVGGSHRGSVGTAGGAETFVAMPPDPRPSRRMAAGGWGVQVGAFRSYDAAVRTATAAKATLGSAGGELAIAIERTGSANHGEHHLARLVGAGREDAYKACGTLKPAGYRCLVLEVTDQPAVVDQVRPADAGQRVAAIAPPQTPPPVKLDDPQPAEETGSTAETSAPSKGRWGVQVGAFAARTSAQKVATAAMRLAPKSLQSGAVKVVRIERKRRADLYGARVVGLTRNQAHEACRKLESSDFHCMVVRL